MVAQEGWRTVAVGTVLTFRVPPMAREKSVRPLDSVVGIIDGDGYQITYDYGRFSERVEEYQHHSRYSVSERRVGSRKAQIASFDDPEGNPDLPFAQLLRIDDGSNALTLRVSCADEASCSLANDILDSVEFR